VDYEGTGKMNKKALILHLLPLLIPFVLFFGTGLGFTFARSLGIGAVEDYRGGSFSAYLRILNDSLFRRNVFFSVKIAMMSALGSIILGSPLAYGIWRLPARWRHWAYAYRIPLILPHITVAFLILFMFSNRGWIPALFHQLDWEILQSDRSFLHSQGGAPMVLAYLYKEIPFVILMELAVLQNIPEDLITTAKLLGARSWLIYRRVVLPYLYPVLNTLFAMLFLYTFGAFDIPFLLGTSRPSMLSIDVYRMYFERDLVYRPLVMSRLILMFLFALLFLLLYRRLSRSFKKRGREE